MTRSTIMPEPASNVEWQFYGKADVGVSHDYASGIAEWNILKSHLQQYGLPEWKTACEIGCGAGRMTNAVAAEFVEVHGLDVSEDRIRQLWVFRTLHAAGSTRLKHRTFLSKAPLLISFIPCMFSSTFLVIVISSLILRSLFECCVQGECCSFTCP